MHGKLTRVPAALAVVALMAGGVRAEPPQARGTPGARPPDPATLVAAARPIQDRDLAAWGQFGFRRRVLRQRLAADGEVTFRQRLDFRVEPLPGGGFDEELLAIDGRTPSAKEVREHRRAARFTKHYRRAVEGRFGGVMGVGELDFRYLLAALDYSYRGREEVDGIRCHHLGIEPVAGEPDRASDPVASITAGELWLSVDGLHIVRAQTRLTRPMSRRLVEVERLEIDFEAQPATDGIWLPSRITVRSSVRGLVRLRAHNVYRYSELEERQARR